jgi:hypothetical protein
MRRDSEDLAFAASSVPDCRHLSRHSIWVSVLLFARVVFNPSDMSCQATQRNVLSNRSLKDTLGIEVDKGLVAIESDVGLPATCIFCRIEVAV